MRLYCFRLPSEEKAIECVKDELGRAGSPYRIPEWVGGKRSGLAERFPCFFGPPGTIFRRMVRCERFPDRHSAVRYSQSEPYKQSTYRAVLAIAAIEGDCSSIHFEGHLEIFSATGPMLFLGGEVSGGGQPGDDPVFWPCIVRPPVDVGRATSWCPLILGRSELPEWFRPSQGHTNLIQNLPAGSLIVKRTSYSDRPKSAFEITPPDPTRLW